MEERRERPVLPMGSMEPHNEVQVDLNNFLCMHAVKEESYCNLLSQESHSTEILEETNKDAKPYPTQSHAHATRILNFSKL